MIMISKNVSLKIKSKKGFSLTETLTTLIIMSLVGIMITVGLATATRVYKQVTEYARAQVLFSTAYTLINDELIYVDPDSVVPKDTESKTISFNNMNKSEKVTLNAKDTVGITISHGSREEIPIVTYEEKENFHTEWETIKFDTGSDSFIIKNFSVVKDDKKYVSLPEIIIKPIKQK